MTSTERKGSSWGKLSKGSHLLLLLSLLGCCRKAELVIHMQPTHLGPSHNACAQSSWLIPSSCIPCRRLSCWWSFLPRTHCWLPKDLDFVPGDPEPLQRTPPHKVSLSEMGKVFICPSPWQTASKRQCLTQGSLHEEPVLELQPWRGGRFGRCPNPGASCP